MSNYFEVMERMGRERTLLSRSDAVLEVQREVESQSTVPFDGWSNEEALRVVQQVFLLQTDEPPHVVVFAGIDHRNGCSHICASVAETLAQNIGNSVCLVEANFRSPALPELFGT